MLRILEESVLERGLEILKALRTEPGRTAGRCERTMGCADRDREGLGNSFRKFSREIALSERRVVAGLEIGDRREGKLVVHTGVVDAERGRKEAVADNFVGGGPAKWNECEREP